MPNKFERPTDPADALYHDVLCGNIELVQQATQETPELIRGKPVINGAWSHGGRRCAAQDDVITCLQLLVDAGADFSSLGGGFFDTAFKAFPRAARFLFLHGAKATVTDDDGTTALHCVVDIGFRSAAGFLLRQGADINAQTQAGDTPLDIAVRRKLPLMVEFLRRHGAESNTTDRDDDAFDATPLTVTPRDGRITGEVVWYRADRGYGYLRDNEDGGGDDGASGIYGELFFDRDDIRGNEPESIEEGTPLSFIVAHDRFGLYAGDVEFGQVTRPSHS